MGISLNPNEFRCKLRHESAPRCGISSRGDAFGAGDPDRALESRGQQLGTLVALSVEGSQEDH